MLALAALLLRLRATLRTLDISHTGHSADHGATAAITSALQACARLETLRVVGWRIDWVSWVGGHYPALTTLDLSHCPGIEVAGCM